MFSNLLVFGITFYTSYYDNLQGIANIFDSMIGNQFIQSFLGGFGGAFLTGMLDKGIPSTPLGSASDITVGPGLKHWAMTGLYAGIASIASIIVLNTINIGNVQLLSAIAAAAAANYAYFGVPFPKVF